MSPKFDRTKSFIKRHKTVLACSATAVATCAITRYVTTQQIAFNDMAISLARLRDEFADLAVENSMLFDFLDSKQLRDEYFEFVKEQVDNT